MVGGAVFCNPYATGQALIAWSLSEWRFFDGWATASGIDILKLSCPRYMNLILHYLTMNADAESKEKFLATLEEFESEVEYKRLKSEEPTPTPPSTSNAEDKIVVPTNNPWKAPPGWKPPGWMSDEENMANIQALMGPQIIGNKTIPK